MYWFQKPVCIIPVQIHTAAIAQGVDQESVGSRVLVSDKLQGKREENSGPIVRALHKYMSLKAFILKIVY